MKRVNRAGYTVLSLDLLTKDRGLCANGLILRGPPQGISQAVHGQFTAWNRIRGDAQLEQAACPEGLVTHERHNDGRNTGAESGCYRARATMVHDRGRIRQ
jgi:hypothetical protein